MDRRGSGGNRLDGLAMSKYNGWRGRLAPQVYFCKVGRRVRCTVCRTWQRTDPAKHATGWRLREMDCSTEACQGRLRSMSWWLRLDAALDAAQAKASEDPSGAQGARPERLDVNVPRGLNCSESGRGKGRRRERGGG